MGILSGEEGQKALRKYLLVAKEIDEYMRAKFDDWCDRILNKETGAEAQLRNFILKVKEGRRQTETEQKQWKMEEGGELRQLDK